MKNKFVASIAALLFSVASFATAAPIEASFVTTGSAGEWVADFTVTNNLEGTNNVYFFGVKAPEYAIVGSPSEAGWAAEPRNTQWSVIPGSTVYNNTWCCNLAKPLKPGESLSGFKVSFDTIKAPTSVAFFAYAYQGNLGNPGFEGTAMNLSPVDAPSDVPEPATLALFGVGAGLLGLSSRRKNRA
jgi:hypothetical protein